MYRWHGTTCRDPGVLRLTRAQLDGPNTDERFDEDFFIDLIFAPVETSKDAPPVSSSGFETSGSGSGGTRDQLKSAPTPPTPSTSTDSGVVLDAQSTDKFEQMLHRDARFWENIADRKVRSKKRKSRKYASNTTEKFSIFDGADFAQEQSRDEAWSRSVDSSQLNYVEEGEDERDENGNDLWQDGGTEVKFYKHMDDSHGDGGMSDQELINQLAQAEFDDDSEEEGEGGEDSLSQQESFVDVQGEGEREQTVETAASKELKALAELEAELGLDFNVMSASSCSDNEGLANSTHSPDKNREKQDESEEEVSQSLDELEDFLQSLNT